MKDFIYQFINQHKLAVVSTINQADKPESALVGIAVSTNLEVIFDTIISTRKCQNILLNPHVAMVVGLDNEITVQYEGEAEILGNDSASDNYRQIYYTIWPEGRERTETWPGLVHVRIVPKWMRYSNFNTPVVIEEMQF